MEANIGKFLQEHVLFKNLEPSFLQALAGSLQSRVFGANEYIIRKGEIGRAMFFILRGEVQVISEDGERSRF